MSGVIFISQSLSSVVCWTKRRENGGDWEGRDKSLQRSHHPSSNGSHGSEKKKKKEKEHKSLILIS